MMTTVGIKAEREGLLLNGLKADIIKIMTSNPRKISAIKVTFEWPGPQGSEKQISMLKKAALTCPVALSLDPAIGQDIRFRF